MPTAMSNAYGVSLNLTDAEARELWGAPESLDDVKALFQKFCSGGLKALPWSDTPVAKETSAIGSQLEKLNGRGFSTINSKPAVDGAPSDDKVHGWGTSNGYVYQKGMSITRGERVFLALGSLDAWPTSSLECFVAPERLDEVIAHFDRNPQITYHAVNAQGDMRTKT
ncbi:unnamed protein product [Tilletia laevis]|nr:hypothetical protein CF336_g8701 [Tilletia laevis]KAE8183017.1 hypothetical protein CF335_g8449 [Tilletia laevis]CAD6884932.1 unnamed protein product [Tilletia caries]CAD6947630.1 unnamed protein product [Tilletia laevis]CAD6947856.1 unnamed protein product [Tilletia caries]